MRKASEEISQAYAKVYRVAKYKEDIQNLEDIEDRKEGLKLYNKLMAGKQRIVRRKSAIASFMKANAGIALTGSVDEVENYSADLMKICEPAIIEAYKIHMAFLEFGDWMVFSGIELRRKSGANKDPDSEDEFEDGTFDAYTDEEFGGI